MASCNCSTGFTFLPSMTYDAMLEVLSLLSVKDLGRLAQVSKDTRSLADDSILWRRLCRSLEAEWARVLNKDISVVPKLVSVPDWKIAFHQERERVYTTAKYIGLWNEKWCDVHVLQSTQIESDGSNFAVTYKKNKFSAQFQEFDGETLSFHLEGGDSGWSFIYKLKPLPDNLLHLTVYRVHDQKTFTGIFTKE